MVATELNPSENTGNGTHGHNVDGNGRHAIITCDPTVLFHG